MSWLIQNNNKPEPHFQIRTLFQKLKSHFTSWTLTLKKEPPKSISISTQLTLEAETINDQITILSDLNLSTAPFSLYLILTPAINNVPVSVESQVQRNLLNGYLLRVNSRTKLGGLFLNPKTGHLKYRIFAICGDKSVFHFVQTDLVQITNLVLNAKKVYQYHLPRILSLLNIGVLSIMKPKNAFAPCLNPKYIEQLQTLQSLASITHSEFSYASKFNFGLKSSTRQEINESSKSIINKLKPKFTIPDQLKQIQPAKVLDLIKIISSKDTHRTKSITTQNQPILDERFLKLKQKIASGGTSDIYLVETMLKHESLDKIVPKMYVKKVAKSIQAKIRLKHERKIAGVLNREEPVNQNIGRYFTVVENDCIQKEGALFMEYFPIGTLQNYILNRQQFFPITTKIQFLLRVLKNLQCLQEYKIEHMDLKPQNVVIDSKLNTRLIDFGQSVMKNEDKAEITALKVGISFPYSPPQFYKPNFTQPVRCDVFSFGVMMFEMLFEQFPFAECRTQTWIQHFRNDSYMSIVAFPPQKIQRLIQQRVGYLLLRLCIKCLSLNPKFRPSLDWIKVYLFKVCILLHNY